MLYYLQAAVMAGRRGSMNYKVLLAMAAGGAVGYLFNVLSVQTGGG